ncbi:cupin domain-containing protein [bacterium]|nr:cupin domain-containing protein [bacterium]
MDTPLSRVIAAGETPAIPAMGAYMELLLESAATGGAFDFFIGTLPPGGGPPLHRHPEAEAIYVLEGEVTFKLGGAETRAAGAGTLLFAPSMAPHGFFNSGDTPARLLVVASPAGLTGLFRDTEDATECFAGPPSPQYMQRMFEAFQRYGMEVLEGPPA